MASKGTQEDLYVRGKNGVFALFYGGNEYTLENRVGVTPKKAKKALADFQSRYPTFKKKREAILKDPMQTVSSMFGHKRSFTFEKRIIALLKKLLEYDFNDGKFVQRRKKEQTEKQALNSAVWGTIYSVQIRCGRQAINHRVQATGSEVTKELQLRVWNIQPDGVHKPKVVIMNVHDELDVVNDCPEVVEKVVMDFITEYKQSIPFLGMEWCKSASSWGEK
jgi:DNA polymerase I-like protein with 3'-5' exonuclease and polymerase domains